MNVTIIGTGNMARGIATRLLAGGNSVALVGHEQGKAEELAGQIGATAAAAGAPLAGDVVVLAVPWAAALPLVEEYGQQLAGKIIVDITNPIDFNTMAPAVAPGTSGAEEIARSVPASAQVLKAFNTTFAGTLVAGEVLGLPLDVLIAGDDAAAKATFTQLVESGGLHAVDAGPLVRARQLEALGLLHIALQFTQNTGFGTTMKLIVPAA